MLNSQSFAQDRVNEELDRRSWRANFRLRACRTAHLSFSVQVGTSEPMLRSAWGSRLVFGVLSSSEQRVNDAETQCPCHGRAEKPACAAPASAARRHY